jgi:hypothetical protein
MPQATSRVSSTRHSAHVCPPRRGRRQPAPIRVARHCSGRVPAPRERNRTVGNAVAGRVPPAVCRTPNLAPSTANVNRLIHGSACSPRTCPRGVHSQSTAIQTRQRGNERCLGAVVRSLPGTMQSAPYRAGQLVPRPSRTHYGRGPPLTDGPRPSRIVAVQVAGSRPPLSGSGSLRVPNDPYA